MTATTTETTVHDEAPPVRLEPCSAYRPDQDAPWPTCEACGWLELEHDDAGAGTLGDAVVTVLPRRVTTMPRRLAS